MADTDTANALGEAHTALMAADNALLAAAKALTRIEHIAEVDAELCHHRHADASGQRGACGASRTPVTLTCTDRTPPTSANGFGGVRYV